MQRTSALRVSLVVAVVAVLAALAWTSWPSAEPGTYRPARATVVDPTNCGSPTPGEVVRVAAQPPGSRRAMLNSCGHRVGEVLDVQVRPAGPDRVEVRLAGAGVTSSAVTEQRVAAILLVVAAGGGAGLAWQLSWRLYSATRPWRRARPVPEQRDRHRHRAAAG